MSTDGMMEKMSGSGRQRTFEVVHEVLLCIGKVGVRERVGEHVEVEGLHGRGRGLSSSLSSSGGRVCWVSVARRTTARIRIFLRDKDREGVYTHASAMLVLSGSSYARCRRCCRCCC